MCICGAHILFCDLTELHRKKHIIKAHKREGHAGGFVRAENKLGRGLNSTTSAFHSLKNGRKNYQEINLMFFFISIWQLYQGDVEATTSVNKMQITKKL